MILRDDISLLGPHLKTIGIRYYVIVLNEKKITKIDHSKNVYENAYCSNRQWRHKISRHIPLKKIKLAGTSQWLKQVTSWLKEQQELTKFENLWMCIS